MTALSWSRGRRYGLFVHLNIATVPAFAPVHEYADWYWSHLSPTPLADVLLHPAPLPEVIAHHRQHFGDDVAFDDLIPLLTLDHFDADALAELARDAGAGYVVPVTKHHDGFCWWDSALTDRTSARSGPHRDVIAEVAAACERADLALGLYYSLLDWAHPSYPNVDGYVKDFLHPQVLELVERFRPALLWGDGQWGHGGDHWGSDRLVEVYRERMSVLGLPAAVNDRWGASEHDLTTFEYDVPDGIRHEPWELCRGLAYSFCWNRAERPEHHLDAAGVVALLAEVVAKGGNLLLNIGPRADGTIPAEQADALRGAGHWVRANADVIDGTVPFRVWGERGACFTTTPDGGTVHVIDPGRSEHLELDALGQHAGRVVDITGALDWRQDENALVVRPRLDGGLASVLRIRWEPRPAPIEVSRRVAPVRHLDESIASATAGDTVTLAAGAWTAAAFPVRVPAGVVVRGEPGATIDGGGLPFGVPVLVLDGDGAGVRDVHITGVADGIMFISNAAVTATAARAVFVDGCKIDGGVSFSQCDGARISETSVRGASVIVTGGQGCVIDRTTVGGLRWGVGVHLDGGDDHRVVGSTVHDSLAGIRVSAGHRAAVSTNDVCGRWWGIHLDDATDAVLDGNRVHDTMRAFTLTAGRGARLTDNSAIDCDSALLLERGVERTRLDRHVARRCRVGLYLWDHLDTVITSPELEDCRDADVIEDVPR